MLILTELTTNCKILLSHNLYLPRMKILYISNRIPFPPQSGYRILVHNTIQGVVNEGVEVTLFSLNPHKHYTDVRHLTDPLLNRIELRSCGINTDFNNWEAVKSIASKKAYTISRFYNENVSAQLKDVLRKNEFDIIQLEGLFVVPYLSLIRQLSKAKVVYRAHNIEYQIWERQADSARSPLRRIYLNILASRLKKYELENINKFDAVTTITNSDKRELQYMGCNLSMETFRVTVNPDEYVSDFKQMEYPSIFHLGSMDWLPNREGVEWFINYVWNDLEQLNVGLKFHIAGKSIPQEFYDHPSKNIVFHSDLHDAKLFMNSKSIMIVPLQSGSGMRVKIIEGMAMKKCIITTSKGAEGIRYEHGKNILIADTPDEFYRYILQCTTDRNLCETIGENARKLIERDHNTKITSKNLMSFYYNLINS